LQNILKKNEKTIKRLSKEESRETILKLANEKEKLKEELRLTKGKLCQMSGQFEKLIEDKKKQIEKIYNNKIKKLKNSVQKLQNVESENDKKKKTIQFFKEQSERNEKMVIRLQGEKAEKIIELNNLEVKIQGIEKALKKKIEDVVHLAKTNNKMRYERSNSVKELKTPVKIKVVRKAKESPAKIQTPKMKRAFKKFGKFIKERIEENGNNDPRIKAFNLNDY
jgi:hypothetical protein